MILAILINFIKQCNAQRLIYIFSRLMGCSQSQSAAVATPLPVSKQRSAPNLLLDPYFQSLNANIVLYALQGKKQQPKKIVIEDQILPFENELQTQIQTRKSLYSKHQLHHPQPNQSQIVEILKDKAEQKALFEKAEQLYKKKSYPQALNLYKKINIEDSYIYTLRGYCNYEQENYDNAIKEYMSSLKLKSDHVPTYFRLGMAYYYKQNYVKALGMFQKCLAVDQNPQIYFQMGNCLYYSQEYDKSIEYHKKALEVNPKNCQIMRAVSDCLFFKEEYEQSIAWMKKVIEIQPKNAKVLCQIGDCFYQMSEYEEAKLWYERSLLINPKDPQTSFGHGRNYHWMEDYQNAILKYQRCIQLDPENQKYYIQIGQCKRLQELSNEAIEWFQKALEINAESTQAYQGLGEAYYQLQQYQQAIQQAQKGIEIDAENTKFNAILANSQYYLENYDTAIENYEIVLLKSAQDSSHYKYMIGLCYQYQQSYNSALPYLKQAIQLDPDNLDYQVQHGKCLFNIENFSECFKVLTKAKQLYESTKNSENNRQWDEDCLVQLNKFIESSVQWEEKKKIGYISPQKKEEIKKMRKMFQKKYKTIFGLGKKGKKNANTIKPVDQQFLEVVSLIHKDKFLLDISSPESPIFKIAGLVRKMYSYDNGSFQIFAYIFQQFMWLQKFESKKSILEIESYLKKVLQALSEKYPSVAKPSANLNKNVEFPTYNEIKMNLFTEITYFQSYDIVVQQIQRINIRAENDLSPFKQFVSRIQKEYEGNYSKAGMKLPLKKQNMSSSQKAGYQHSLFKGLMRIFQKMFKQIVNKKEEMLETINLRIASGKNLPLYTVNQVIMNTWIQYINKILLERKAQGIKTECYISDLVRGKCMFPNIQKLQNAANGVIKLCKEKNYQIMQLDNRLLKVTQDVVFKIKIKEVVCEFQLALQFDTQTFEFGHNFYQIQRCPLGCIFGSSLFLTKDVSESFLKQIANTIESMNAMKSKDKQHLKSLHFVLNAFKKSSKIREY